MPTLQFKGKNIIWNHHLAIPYHTLDEIKELNFYSPKAASPKKKVIVYTPACFLDEEYLEDNQIQFVSIPYNLFHLNN